METDADSPAPRPGRPRDESREQAILEAALELLVEVGYDRMSMDAVAARAHASKATIYRRWRGKADVVADAIRRRTCLDAACTDTGDIRSDLLRQLAAMHETMQKVDWPLITGVMLAAQADPELGAVLRSTVMNDKQQVWVRIVDRAVARGELPPGTDPTVLGEVAAAMGCHRMLVHGEAFDDEFRTYLVDSILLPLLRQAQPQPQF